MGSARPAPDEAQRREESAVAFWAMGFGFLVVHYLDGDPRLWGFMMLIVGSLYYCTAWTEWQIWWRTISAAILLGLLTGCTPGEDGCPHPVDERVTETTCRHRTENGWSYHSD